MKGIGHSLDLPHPHQRIEKHFALDLTIKLGVLIVQALPEIIEGFIYHRSLKWKRRRRKNETCFKRGMKINAITCD